MRKWWVLFFTTLLFIAFILHLLGAPNWLAFGIVPFALGYIMGRT